MIKNAKFSGFCFYMNTDISGDLQICISVPLKKYISVVRRRTSIFIKSKNF